MLVPMVDAVFADVAQPDQARLVALNASLYVSWHWLMEMDVADTLGIAQEGRWSIDLYQGKLH